MLSREIVIPLLIATFIGGLYCGVRAVKSDYEAKIKEMEATYAQAVIDAQLEEKKKYEAKQEDLLRRFNDDARHHAERVRQLEAKLRARTDVDTLKRERDRAIGLAVEGEALLREGGRIIEALK